MKLSEIEGFSVDDDGFRTTGPSDCDCQDMPPGRILDHYRDETSGKLRCSKCGRLEPYWTYKEGPITLGDMAIGDAETAERMDNWAHRSQEMRCRSCMWFMPKDTGLVGRCRRHAPTLGGWPVVYPSDSCGDHKLR